MTVVLREEPIFQKQKYEFPRSVIFFGSLIVIVGIAVVGCAISFLYFHVHHGPGRLLASIVPIPTAVVDGRLVWYHQVAETANTLETEAGMSADEAIDRALIRAIRERIMEKIAESVSVPIVNDELVFAANLETAVLASSTYQSAARGRLERIVTKLGEGLPFYDLATQYSAHSSAASGGDLGYVDVSTLPVEVQSTVGNMAIGTTSDVIATEKSFWLYRVEDILEDEAGNVTTWLRVIEMKKDLLGTVVDAELARADVREFLH